MTGFIARTAGRVGVEAIGQGQQKGAETMH